MKQKKDVHEKHIDLILRWQKKPLEFIEDVWGLVPQPIKKEHRRECRQLMKDGKYNEVESDWFEDFEKGKHITWQQWLVFESVERALAGKAPKRISISSGHGTGKSAALSMLAEWYLFCFKESQVPCTAPSSEQMYDVLWKEIKKWLDKMPNAVANLYDYSSQYLRIIESPKTWFARAKTARKEKPEALAGIHGDYVLMLIDEASGVEEEIYNTAEGALTSEDILVIMISNPTRTRGYFFDSHHDDKDNWQTLIFNAEESPIVDWSFVERIKEKHGAQSDEYRIRVLGQFPRQDEGLEGWTRLINISEIDFALEAGEEVEMVGIKAMGCDVADKNGDDESVICIRSMNVAHLPFADNKTGTMSFAGQTIRHLEDYDVNPLNVAIDPIGVGAGVLDRVREQKYAIYGVHVGEKANEPRKFKNKKAEVYWQAREWIKQGGKLKNECPDEPHKSRWYQLSDIYYRTDSRGRIEIMKKSVMRKHGIASPDGAEAFAFTFSKGLTPSKVSAEDVFFKKKMEEKNKKKIKRSKKHIW